MPGPGATAVGSAHAGGGGSVGRLAAALGRAADAPGHARSKPTGEAKTTTAEMPTAGLGVGVPTADAAPGALDGGEREQNPHRLRTGEQCDAEQLGAGADQA